MLCFPQIPYIYELYMLIWGWDETLPSPLLWLSSKMDRRPIEQKISVCLSWVSLHSKFPEIPINDIFMHIFATRGFIGFYVPCQWIWLMRRFRTMLLQACTAYSIAPLAVLHRCLPTKWITTANQPVNFSSWPDDLTGFNSRSISLF